MAPGPGHVGVPHLLALLHSQSMIASMPDMWPDLGCEL